MKINVDILKKARKESNERREQLIADLQKQVQESIDSYIVNVSENIPAGAETLVLYLKSFLIEENFLKVTIDKQFTPSDSKILSEYYCGDCIALCKVEGAVLTVPEEDETFSSVVRNVEKLSIDIVNKVPEISLYYKEIFGNISLRELWGEDIPKKVTIDLT